MPASVEFYELTTLDKMILLAVKIPSSNKRLIFPSILFIYFIYLLFSHNKDYTSITLYKDVARGPQKTTRLVRGGPLVTIILSNRTITTQPVTRSRI